MANEVYANGMEIACKAAAGKSIAAFPDTCLTPPPPPAGPIPVPYPNTAYASDTTKGTTTVMISGQEIMMKDQSTFKKSTGDEAATRAQGMGVVTHIIQGEASFIAWSMDVKIEGHNVDRHLDQMMHNEQCSPANTCPRLSQDGTGKSSSGGACNEVIEAVNRDCTKKSFAASGSSRSKCCAAKKCVCSKYGSNPKCCSDKTKHHIIPDHCFKGPGKGGYYHGF